MNYADRRTRLRQQLGEHKVDVLAVSPGPDMFYLMGFHPLGDERPCYLFLTEDDEALLVPELNAAQTGAHVQLPITTWSDNDGPVRALQNVMGKLRFGNARSILVNGPMRADHAILLQEHVPSAKLGTATDILGHMRMRKDEDEIAAMRANAAQADAAMQAGWSALREGATELDIAREVEAAFGHEGADATNFAIIGTGANGAYPHHHSEKRAIDHGDAVVMDIGGTANAYNSDLTRMAYMGEPSDEYLKVHETVDGAVRAALAVVKPGTPAGQVDDAARGVITEAGYGEYFTHRTGHGIGLETHEPPYMTANNTLPLEKGMTFSIEPGIYLPGKFGVRLEEIVVVTDSGVEIFSRLPRDLHRAA